MFLQLHDDDDSSPVNCDGRDRERGDDDEDTLENIDIGGDSDEDGEDNLDAQYYVDGVMTEKKP